MRADPRRAADVPRWLPATGIALALAGLAVTGYLLYEHYHTATVLACPENGVVNCRKVTSSDQSRLFGVPIVWPGLAFFLVMLAANLPAAWRSRNPWVLRGRLAVGLGGVAFVLYLIYAELFVLEAICLWCTAVHALTIGLFGLAAVGTAVVTQPPAPGPAVTRPRASSR